MSDFNCVTFIQVDFRLDLYYARENNSIFNHILYNN